MRPPGADGQPFSYSAPVLKDHAVRVIFGPRSLAQVASEARTLGSRIMIISGSQEADAAAAVGADTKGKLLPLVYAVAIPAAFLRPWIAGMLFVLSR